MLAVKSQGNGCMCAAVTLTVMRQATHCGKNYTLLNVKLDCYIPMQICACRYLSISNN